MVSADVIGAQSAGIVPIHLDLSVAAAPPITAMLGPCSGSGGTLRRRLLAQRKLNRRDRGRPPSLPDGTEAINTTLRRDPDPRPTFGSVAMGKPC
jgi:hypothetical protein